jgi:hypothetical protein
MSKTPTTYRAANSRNDATCSHAHRSIRAAAACACRSGADSVVAIEAGTVRALTIDENGDACAAFEGLR